MVPTTVVVQLKILQQKFTEIAHEYTEP
jgi:hypothetical protein